MTRTSKIVAIAVGGLVLIGAAIAVTLAIVQPSAGMSKPATAKTITVSGALHLHAPSRWFANDSGASCDGGIAGGLQDIQPGTQVVIYDAGGKIVASGGLLDGTIDAQAGSNVATCRMPFQIEKVPAGVGPYSIEIGHRGKVVFNADEASNVDVTLGSDSNF